MPCGKAEILKSAWVIFVLSRAEILRKFPVGFPIEKLPKGIKEEEIEVYRICRTGRIEEASFLPTYLDELSKTKENADIADPEIGYYSLSTYEKERDARKKLKFFRGKRPDAIASKGITACSCGVVQRTRERTGCKDSHIDWWLYDGAQPHKLFCQVQLDD